MVFKKSFSKFNDMTSFRHMPIHHSQFAIVSSPDAPVHHMPIRHLPPTTTTTTPTTTMTTTLLLT